MALDRSALLASDLAYMEEPLGTPISERVAWAIHAYLWALAWPAEHPDDLDFGPGLNDWREHRARTETP